MAANSWASHQSITYMLTNSTSGCGEATAHQPQTGPSMLRQRTTRQMYLPAIRRAQDGVRQTSGKRRRAHDGVRQTSGKRIDLQARGWSARYVHQATRERCLYVGQRCFTNIAFA